MKKKVIKDEPVKQAQPIYICKRCHYEWEPRLVEPRRCPDCCSKRWRTSPGSHEVPRVNRYSRQKARSDAH